MCAPSQGVMMPYGLKIPSPYFPFGPSGSLSQVHLSALDFQRSQLNEYNVRVQLGLRNYQNSIGLSPFQAYINDPYTQAYFYKHDPRARFVQEEPKPSHSYIGLIGMAILNSKDKKLVLSDIYQWILDNYPYFRTRGPGWRNSIRHNLSLNDCFIKAGRSANGKGHYWAVHPANVEDFERGDFRRRRAQRKVRRHMGLSVPDDDDSPTPSPTQPWPHHDLTPEHDRPHLDTTLPVTDPSLRPSAPGETDHLILPHHRPTYGPMPGYPRKPKKRLFDMASLLAPDEDDEIDIGKDLNSPDGGSQGQLIPNYLHPMRHLTPHDLKVERNSVSSHSSDFSQATPTQDLTVDVIGGKDVTYDSDEDIDNDEIHVTSGENSPSRDMDDCDMDQDHLDSSEYLSRKNKEFSCHELMTSRSYDSTQTSSPCQPTNGAKPDNALDLTSQTPASSSTDRKEHFCSRSEEHLHFPSKTLAHNSGLKEDFNKNEASQRDIDTKGHGPEQEVSTGSQGPASDKPPHDGEEMNSMKHSYLNVKSTNGVAEDDQEFSQPHTDTSGRDQTRHTVENSHFYRPDLHELKRQQILRGFEANFNLLDSNHVLDSDRCPIDVRRTGADRTSPLADTLRVSADTLRWADLTKPAVSVDRASAFSSLAARSHVMYSPFQMQMRNFSLAPHRLLQSVVPVRGGVPQPLLPGAPAPHSMPIMKGMEAYTNSGVTTNNPSLSIANHNSTSRSGARD